MPFVLKSRFGCEVRLVVESTRKLLSSLQRLLFGTLHHLLFVRSFVFLSRRNYPSLNITHLNLLSLLALNLWRIYPSQHSIHNHPSSNLPFISASPSASIFLFIACASLFSILRAFLALNLALGPLVGKRPGLAPRVVSAFATLSLGACDRLRRSLRALEARAARRFLEGPLGLPTEGIVTICVGCGDGWRFCDKKFSTFFFTGSKISVEVRYGMR